MALKQEKPMANKGPPSPHKKFNKNPGSKFQGKNTNSQFNSKVVNLEANKPGEKTNWNQFKKQKKELKLKRRQTGKGLFELTVQAKKLYEKLKCKSTPNKSELVKELHLLLRGDVNYQKLVLAHDTARIVQCVLKYSTGDVRQEISLGLLPVVPQMVFSKYAHYCVMRMIKYGTPNVKQKTIEGLYGGIVKMVCNAISSQIIDVIYVSWASSQQKAYMRQEIYGDLYKNSKDSTVKCIADTYRNSEHMKAAVLGSIKSNLNHVVNKKLVDNGLIHSVLIDYLKESSEEDRIEMITAFTPYIPSLASTKDGVRASINCFWYSIVKERRAIVKSLKEHLIKLCTHEHGHMLILAIINSMDDTKALKKSIFDPIYNEIQTIASNEWGRKVIEWFVAPEDRLFFHAQTIAYLDEGLKYSKKDKETRRSELLEAVTEPLCISIIDHPSFWLRGGHTGLALVAIIKQYKGDHLGAVYEKLADVICNVEWKVNPKEIEEKTEAEISMTEMKKQIKKKYTAKETEPEAQDQQDTLKSNELELGVEHAGLHMVLKKLLKLDKENITKGLPTFGAAIVKIVTPDTIKAWLNLNRSSFLLLLILENDSEETQNVLKAQLKNNVKLLKKQTHAAASLLLKKIN